MSPSTTQTDVASEDIAPPNEERPGGLGAQEDAPEPPHEAAASVELPASTPTGLARPTFPPGDLKPLTLPNLKQHSESLATIPSEAEDSDLAPIDWENDPMLGVELLDGRYVIESVIGEGGYGVVYRATQRATGQFVAVKVMRQDKISGEGESGTELARFEREMRLIGQLNHPNIVRLIDYGQLDDDNLFTILEYIDGVALSDLLHDEGALRPNEARALMLQVLEALGATHELGIVYRDLKPHNLMITTSGVRRGVKLLDFGISGLIEDARDSDYENLTQEGVINGTPSYMAPEQLHGWALTPQSDIYSWGLVFLELLTGQKAVRGASYVDVLAQQISKQPVEIPEEIRDQPLGEIIARAVAKPLDERYESVREALYDLEDCVVPQTMVLPWTGQRALERLQQSISLRNRSGGHTPSGQVRSSWSDPVRTGDIPIPTTGEVREAEVAQAAEAVAPSEVSDSSRPIAAPGVGAASAPERFDEALDEPEPKRGKGGLIALVLLLLIGVVGAVIAMSSDAQKTTPSPDRLGGSMTAPASPSQTTAALATPTTAGGGAKVAPSEPDKATAKPALSVVVSAAQQDATIALDGKPQGKGSVTLSVPDDGAEHTLTISAEGFKPHTQTFTGALTLKDVKLDALKADATPTHAPSMRRSTSRRGTSRRSTSRVETKPAETKPAETKPAKVDPWKIKSSDLEDPWKKR